jgi:predicted small lipoprotein YifL
MRDKKITALTGVVFLILTACGQRGPLYIPADNAPAENAPAENSTPDKSSAKNTPVKTPTANIDSQETVNSTQGLDKKSQFETPSLYLFEGA